MQPEEGKSAHHNISSAETCGAGMLEPCKLHPELCNMHRLMAQARELYGASGAVKPDPPVSDHCVHEEVAEQAIPQVDTASTSVPGAASTVSSETKVSSAEHGRKGAAKRLETLRLRKEAGVKKQQYTKSPSLEKQIEVVKYILNKKPE